MKTKFILLHPQDNVLVCCQQAKAGELIGNEQEKLVLLNDMELGHKVSRSPLAQGDKIIKYGVSIGSALQDINAGDHVHMHNMISDYMPAHTRDRVQEIDENK